MMKAAAIGRLGDVTKLVQTQRRDSGWTCDRVTFKLGLMTYRCLHAQAPRYLADHVTPAIEVASRHRPRSAKRHRLIVPRCRLNTYGRQAFPVAGLTVWNSHSLPDELRDPACDVDSFKQFFNFNLVQLLLV